MPNVRAALGVAMAGAVCVVIGAADLAVASPLCAVAAIIGLPMLAAAWSLDRSTPPDLLGRASFAFAGLAVSCWSLWVAALAAGPGRWPTLVTPVVVSAMVVAASDTRREHHASGQNAVPPTAARRWQTLVWATAAVSVVLVLVPFLPYGLQRADGVHRMGMTDWYKHLIVTTALQESGFPPSNPFLITDAHAPYYYGFHLVAAAVGSATGGTDVYLILLALTLLTAVALPMVLFVLARGLFGDSRRAAVAALGGTLLAGFDLAVWILHALRDIAAAWPLTLSGAALRAAVPSTNLDFWIHHNERQFSPPYIGLIWAPQHVAATLVALLAIHAVHRAQREPPTRGSALLPAIMLAALPALSAYVAMALACGIAGSVLLDCWRERRAPWGTQTARRWRWCALLGGAAALPVAWVLSGSHSGHLTFAVSSAGTWLNGALFSALLGDGTLTRLLDTPALYCVEFGIVGLLGLAAIRRRIVTRDLSTQQREAIAIVVAIVLLVAIVRPPIGGPNNLYARPLLIVWALLACFAADAWCGEPRHGRWRQLGVAVGAAGILLGAVGMTAEGLAFWATPVDSVAAARWINAATPPDAVVAADPQRHNLGIWLRRRMAVADRRHAVLFGATTEQYDDTVARLRSAYSATEPGEAARRFAEIGASVVVVDSPAPAWAQPPCFDVGYRGATVTVLARRRPLCAP